MSGREPARAAVPCTLPGGKGRSAPCNPSFTRSQPTARRSKRRAARGWTACARAYHRAASRYGLLRPSASAPAVESDVAGTVPARARPTSLQPRCTLASFARQGSPGTSRKLSAARKLSRKSRSLPLDPRWRGGARMASRAKTHRARRKNSAYARAAFAR